MALLTPVHYALAGDEPAGGVETEPLAAAVSDPIPLFFVQRSKNRNEVHYEISLDQTCRPLGDKPVHNYWLRLEEAGERKPVTLFQQAAYGFKSQRTEGRHVDVVLRALPDLLITVVVEPDGGGCAAAAYTSIAGERARLERVYVMAEDGILMPDVKYVELFGKREGGESVSERLEPE